MIGDLLKLIDEPLGDNWFIILVIFLSVVLTYYNYTRINLYRCSLQLPGPLAFPIIGNAHLLMPLSPNEIQPRINSWVYNFGKIIRVWLGPELNVVVADPEAIEKVLFSTHALHKGPSYRYIKKYIGPGLLGGEGPLWKSQRKAIFSHFKQKFLEKHMESFNICSMEAVQHLQKLANGKTFVVFHEIADFVHKSVCETLLGFEPDEELSKHSTFIHQVEKLYEVIFLRMSKWLYQFDIFFKNSRYFINHKEVSRLLKNFYEYAYSRKYVAGPNKNCALNALVTKNTSIKEFGYNALTLQTASEESVSTIVSFILMVCGIKKDVQKKLNDELDAVFGDSERFINKDDLSDLVYLDYVVKETLRMFPIGSVITRKVEKDFKITDDLTLPTDCIIAIPVYAIHHHPDLWNDPTEFIPERFSPEESKDRHPCSFLPFSHGPMNCVGQKFAIWMIKVFAANLLRNYNVDCQYKNVKDIELMTDISIRPVKGYLVNLTPKRKF